LGRVFNNLEKNGKRGNYPIVFPLAGFLFVSNISHHLREKRSKK